LISHKLAIQRTLLFVFLILCLGVKAISQDKFNRRYEQWLSRVPWKLNITEYLCVVVISEQCNYIFQHGRLLGKYLISTGSHDRWGDDRSMKEGVWRLGKKFEKELPQMYGPRLIYLEAYNPAYDKFFETEKAFHGTDEPQNLGKPTSQGCIYHSNEDIIKLYDLLPDKTLVLTVEK
jgi:hypothetical protein